MKVPTKFQRRSSKNNSKRIKGNLPIVEANPSPQKAEGALQRPHDKLEDRVNSRTAALTKANQELLAAEGRLEERLKFERLLAEMSARFVNLPADRIDSGIEDAQRRICEFLDLDRSSLWQSPEMQPGKLLLTHFLQIGDSPWIAVEGMNAGDYFPWAVQKVLRGEVVTISKIADLPPEADRDRESLRAYGTKSNVCVPLSVGEGPVFGLLTFAVLRQERSWPEAVVAGFQLISQVFANALARKLADNERRENELRLNLATTAAEAGLWIMEIDTGNVWATPKTRELFHFAPDEALTYDSFFNVIHPEDREQVNQTIQQALQSGASLQSDFRIVLPEGCVRWINARGQRYLKSPQESDRLMGVSIDITERKQAEQALNERLRFETLLTEMSARFVNLPADRIDSEIQNAQRRICQLLGLDLAALWQWSNEAPEFFIPTHLYSAKEGPQSLDGMDQEHFPWARQQMLAGRIVAFSSIEELPSEAARDRESCRLFGIKSNLTLPLSVGGNPPIGILGFNATLAERTWPEEIVRRLQLVAQVFANALERKRMEGQRLESLREIEGLKQRLEKENIYLREEVKLLTRHGSIVGKSLAMKNVLSQAEQVAATDSTVLLLGETGTGKELLARAIHGMSLRKDRPMITVNCASLPPTLIESELFGREKGAYTGAMTKMAGRFEIAEGKTLFLDEIGELPFDLQSKLLRVLEEGSFERVGSTKTLHVDVRIIAATNRDIEQEVKSGNFRQDLFYRLNVFPIVIPPLRERPIDIPPLVRALVKEFQKKMGKEIENIPKRTMQDLQSYSWPGNVRELKNVIEHAMILSKGKTLEVRLPNLASSEMEAAGNLETMERRHIVAVLEKTDWRIAGRGGAAEVLGLKRTTLQAKMKKLGIRRSSKEMPK